MNMQKRLANQIYELSIQYEAAEADGRPVIALADRIGTLRTLLAAAKEDAKEPVMLPVEQADLREWFWNVVAQPKPQVESDGDVLWA